MAGVEQPELFPTTPAVKVTVGGRPVLTTGTVVLQRDDTDIRVALDDLVFVLSFVPDPGILHVDAQIVDQHLMRIRFVGTIGPLGAQYELPHVGFWGSRALHLSCMVHAISEDDTVARQVGYTFSLGEQLFVAAPDLFR